MKPFPLLSISLDYEHDVVTARQRAKQVAQLLDFEPQDQIRIATAISELARNAFGHATGGKVRFFLEDSTPAQVLLVQVVDTGPGIDDLDNVLEGRTPPVGGSGLGLVGARKLVDSFHIESRPGSGTSVTIRKARSPSLRPISQAGAKEIVESLVGSEPRTPVDELRQQNQELLTALEALERNQREQLRLNQELEDTNRGVVALYAELDEKAKELHQANLVKSRFLTHMSHEFRTPLNSVLALSRLLLDRTDGELSEEQSKQVVFIRRAASDLLEMVNDLLDLAKVEAGTMPVELSEVHVPELLSALRGMFLPLVTSPEVSLVFESPENLPPLWIDERKLTQILRNLVGNALKFTAKGEVRVAATLDSNDRHLVFTVSDTGPGIEEQDQEHIFDEFQQASNVAKHKTMGSGLGLAISRKLADLIHSEIGVESRVGVGSTFWLKVPLPSWERPADPSREDRIPVLAINDSSTRPDYETLLEGSRFGVEISNGLPGKRELGSKRQAVLIVHEHSTAELARKRIAATGVTLPVLLINEVPAPEKTVDLQLSPAMVSEELLGALDSLSQRLGAGRALVVDDNDIDRYILRGLLVDHGYTIVEAGDGEEGLSLASQQKPAVVFLDLMMPGLNGFDVLKELRSNSENDDVGIVVITSKSLDKEERQCLSENHAVLLPKTAYASGNASRQVLDALSEALSGRQAGSSSNAG